jgi:hypothetical protein
MAGLFDEIKNSPNILGYQQGATKPTNNLGGLLNFALMANQFAPVTGDIQSGIMAAGDLQRGNYGNAALNAVGLLPFIPSLGAVTKNVTSDSVSNDPKKWLNLTKFANDDILRSKFLTKYKDYKLYHEDLTDPEGVFGDRKSVV